MNKIACYKCSSSLVVKDSEAFTKKECSSCGTEIEVPKICGEFILTKELSKNKYYETYKGHKVGLEENLVVKVFTIESQINDKKFIALNEKLSNLPEKSRLKFKKTQDYFLAYRPFFETSLEEYLKTSRPQYEKVIYILDQTADILKTCTEKELYPSKLTIGNLLMDSEGQVILTDLLLRESLIELLNIKSDTKFLNSHFSSVSSLEGKELRISDTLFTFGCLSYVICCGQYPWPLSSAEISIKARSFQPNVKLDLRDKNPESLQSMIEDLIDEKNSKLSNFVKVKNILGLNPSEKSSKTSKKKTLLSTSTPPKTRISRKRKTSNPLPLILGITALAAALAIVFVIKNNKQKEAEIADAKIESTPKVNKQLIKKPSKEKKVIKTAPVQKLAKKEEIRKPAEVKVIKKVPVKRNRDAIKAELMPPDFNFDPIVEKLDEYIDATDVKEREIEEDKIEIVSLFRDHLLIHFYRHPYSGIIHLQNKGVVRAKVVKADEENIQLLNLKTKKPFSMRWQDFEFSQFKEFADYYAASYTEQFSLSESNEKMFQKVSKEYITVAVFLDWYGFKKEAIEYKQKALKFDASQVAKLDLMIKEEPTN